MGHNGQSGCIGSGRRIAVVVFSLAIFGLAAAEPIIQGEPIERLIPLPKSAMDLNAIPYKIVHETYRSTGGRLNWELHMMNADGSNAINITKTPDIDEMYAHASPDGGKIAFVVDQGNGRNKVRSVHYMNIDGTGRVKVAHNARQPCWSPDGRYIAYLEGEYEKYSTREYATSELFFYDLQTGERRAHVNKDLHHVYGICWIPKSQWFTGVVHGGMGYSDTILAFEVNGKEVIDLAPWGVKGCRPDLAPDGRTMVWGETDWDLCTGFLDVSGDSPQVARVRKVVACAREDKVYHVDLSPDGKYITFAFGPVRGGQQVGGRAKGWDICVGDLDGKWVQITNNGNHNKEPEWVPMPSTENSAK